MDKMELSDWSKNELIREVKLLRHLLEEQINAAPGTGPDVTVHGIVASKTREPLVQMRSGEASWQMTPAQARQHALILLDAAVECERDAATIAFIEDEMDLGPDRAGAFLQSMREHRKDWFEEFRTMDAVTVTEVEDGPDDPPA